MTKSKYVDKNFVIKEKKIDTSIMKIYNTTYKKEVKFTSKEFEELVLKKLEKLDKIDSLEEKISNTDKTLKKLSVELKNLNNKFTVFDYEINKKIDSLFDAFVVNTEKDSVHEEKIESLDEKSF